MRWGLKDRRKAARPRICLQAGVPVTDYSRFSRDELLAKLCAAEMELERIRANREIGNRPTDCVGDSLAAVELRRCALERLRAQPMSAIRPPTEAESLRLIHELHVHQIELELQNEELRETQARLEWSLERYTDLYDFAPVGYFTLTGDGVIHEVNFAGAALLGQARSHVIGTRFGLWVAVASRPAFTAFLDRLIQGGCQQTCEATLEPEGAPPRSVRLEGMVSGADRYCRLVAVDITERKQAEEALRAREQQLSAVFRAVPAAVGVSVQHIFQQVNDYFYQALGYRPEQIIGQSTRLIFPSDGAFERLDREIQRQIERTGLAVVETQTHGKDGRLIDILLQVASLVPNQPDSGRVFCALDITERKRIETALRESEERFRLFMDHSPTVAWIKDEEGRYVYLSKTYQQRFNAPVEAWQGKIDSEVWPTHTAEKFRRDDMAALAANKPLEIIDEILEAGGVLSYWHTVKIPFRNTTGRRFVGGIAVDITAQKRTDLELRARETLLRTIMENSPDPIFMADRANRVLYVNSAALAVLNSFGRQPPWTLETLVGKTPLDFFDDPALARTMRESDQRVLESGQVVRAEERIATISGVRVYLSIRSPLRDDAGRIVGLVGIAHDITEQKQGEVERLARLERQRDTLVREVHHRIKNHLQGVTGLLRNRITRRPELAEDLEEVITQICAIAHVYGLQSHHAEGGVRLDELLKILVCGAAGPVVIHCVTPAPESGAMAYLAREEAVSLALVLNELLTNALKHNDLSKPTRPVRVVLETGEAERRVVIRNGPAMLPATFDFAAGQGLGIGLELLRALLPPQGTALRFRQEADEVVAELRLTASILGIGPMGE